MSALRPAMTVVFGLRSPYAWMADHLIERYLPAEARARIAFVPFWNPRAETLDALRRAGGDFLYRDMAKDRHLYVLRDVRRLAAHLGLPLRWPVDRPDTDWEAAHRLYLRAEAEGRGADARRLLFAARWTEGRDLSDEALLGEVADRLALNPETPAPDTAAVIAPLLAAHRLRTFGLPYLAVGADRFWGCDRLAFALAAAGLPHRGVADAWAGGALEEAA